MFDPITVLVAERDDPLRHELILALVEIGEVRRVRDLCDKLLSDASPLGVYAE